MPTTAAKLQSILENEVVLFRGFVHTLEDEAHILSQDANDDTLAENTACKSSQAEKLAALANRRSEALAAMGFTPDPAGLDMAIHRHPELISLHSEIKQLAAKAFELNTANGIMLDAFVRHNRQTLNELGKLAGYGELYDGTGRNTPRLQPTRARIRAG
ncbi:flagella synthesis protein FlgN [Allopusillimonas ginsengisoli]|uniref:flagella synthesis protein FlgN n=1 Tax=Allopusillimonas ginsengisoli TaxID=453575 RepID=UPI00148599FA